MAVSFSLSQTMAGLEQSYRSRFAAMARPTSSLPPYHDLLALNSLRMLRLLSTPTASAHDALMKLGDVPPSSTRVRRRRAFPILSVAVRGSSPSTTPL